MSDHIQIGDISPRVQYIANGTQDTFTYGFPIFESTNIEVFVGSDQKSNSTDFTVSGAGTSAGGFVTFVLPPASGATITLRRAIPIKRTTDFQESGEFRAKVINDELDTLVAYCQELRDDLKRAIRLNGTDVDSDLVLPDATTRASKMLTFGSGGAVSVSSLSTTDIEAGSVSAAADAAVAVIASTEAVAAKVIAEAAKDSAAASATAAAAAGAANLFWRVIEKSASDSPYTVLSDVDDGTFFTVANDGDVAFVLPPDTSWSWCDP